MGITKIVKCKTEDPIDRWWSGLDRDLAKAAKRRSASSIAEIPSRCPSLPLADACLALLRRNFKPNGDGFDHIHLAMLLRYDRLVYDATQPKTLLNSYNSVAHDLLVYLHREKRIGRNAAGWFFLTE